MRAVTRHAVGTNYASTAEPSITPTLFGVSLADHWCDLGHVLYVLEGELDTELRDGRKFKLLPGMSYQVSNDGDAPHRSSTQTGAKLFIVD